MFSLKGNANQMRSLRNIRQKAELNGMEICRRDHPGFDFHITGILFRKSNLKLSSALMDQRAEKLCCTGNCMYSMSDVPCLRKMGNADKIKKQAFVWSVCSDFPVSPSPIKPIFCFRVQNSSWFS